MESMLRRGVVGAVLLIVLGSMFVGFGTLSDDVDDPLPSERVIVTQYDEFVGEKVTLSGTVVDIEPAIIEVDYVGGTQRFAVAGEIPPVEIGDRLTVYGALRPDYDIASERAIREAPENRVYMYSISVVALGVLAILGYRTWTFNLDTLELHPREERDA